MQDVIGTMIAVGFIWLFVYACVALWQDHAFENSKQKENDDK